MSLSSIFEVNQKTLNQKKAQQFLHSKQGAPSKGSRYIIPSKIEWDLTNGPLSKLLELLDTQVFSESVRLWEISWNYKLFFHESFSIFFDRNSTHIQVVKPMSKPRTHLMTSPCNTYVRQSNIWLLSNDGSGVKAPI